MVLMERSSPHRQPAQGAETGIGIGMGSRKVSLMGIKASGDFKTQIENEWAPLSHAYKIYSQAPGWL